MFLSSRYRLLLTFALAFFVGAAVAHADQRELKGAAPDKLDAVLLLDSSGSMLTTDPQRLRDQGAKLFTQFLKNDDRLGIVQFSEVAAVVRPLTPYAKEHAVEVETQISQIQNNGAFTNLLVGINRAKAMLDEAPRENTNQIIILLSDGKMDPPPTAGTSVTLTNELTNGVLPDLKAKGIKIYTLAFSNEADKELLSSIALGTEAIGWYTESADKIHESYADLFLAVKRPQIVPLTSKGFHVDQDVQEATFYISRKDASELEIAGPNGTKISEKNKGSGVKWFTSEKFDVITIEHPETGDWSIAGLPPEDGFATILTNLKLVTDWPTSINAQSEVILQARLYDSDKPVALPEVSGATKFGFQVIPTDQVSAPIIKEFLKDDGKNGDKIAGDGIFSATIEIEDAGEYKIRVVAQGPTFTRNQQTPFRVKPPLISLKVVKREITESDDEPLKVEHGGGHGGGGAGGEEESTEETHTEAHAVAAEESHKQGSEAAESDPSSEEAGHSEKAETTEAEPEKRSEKEKEKEKEGSKSLISERVADVFVMPLSDEAAQLKELTIKFVIIDDKRQRMVFTPTRVDEKGVRFEFPASNLPHDGEYELQAFLTGVTKQKKPIKTQSKIVHYSKVRIEGEEEVHLIVADKKPKEIGFPWVGLLALIAISSAGGAAGIGMLKKSQSATAVVVPNFAPLTEALSLIESLQKTIEMVEVNLDDPMFTDPNYQVVAGPSAGGEASTAAPAETATEAPPAEGGEAAATAQEEA